MGLSCELLQLVKHFGIAKTPASNHQTILKRSEAVKLLLLLTMQTAMPSHTLAA